MKSGRYHSGGSNKVQRVPDVRYIKTRNINIENVIDKHSSAYLGMATVRSVTVKKCHQKKPSLLSSGATEPNNVYVNVSSALVMALL